MLEPTQNSRRCLIPVIAPNQSLPQTPVISLPQTPVISLPQTPVILSGAKNPRISPLLLFLFCCPCLCCCRCLCPCLCCCRCSFSSNHPPKGVILSEVTRALCELRSRTTCGCSCRCSSTATNRRQQRHLIPIPQQIAHPRILLVHRHSDRVPKPFSPCEAPSIDPQQIRHRSPIRELQLLPLATTNVLQNPKIKNPYPHPNRIREHDSLTPHPKKHHRTSTLAIAKPAPTTSKIKSEKVEQISAPKSDRQQTTFATLFTTNSPQKHHIYDAFSSKTPAKTPHHHKQKKAARQTPNRPFLIRAPPWRSAVDRSYTAA